MRNSISLLSEGGRDAGDRVFETSTRAPVRRGFTPPLVAGLLAAVLFAGVLGFFLMPSASVGVSASDSRTRWVGSVDAAKVLAQSPDRAENSGRQAPVALAAQAGGGMAPTTPASTVASGRLMLDDQATLALPSVQAEIQDQPKPDPIVARVQSLLGVFGYDVGPADGLAGKQTWSAIEQFRLDRSLPLDEPLSLALLDQLEFAQESGWRPPLFASNSSDSEIAAAVVRDLSAAESAEDRTLQRVPGLRLMAAPERHVLERWCTSGRNAADLEGYYRCLSESLLALQRDAALPALADLDVEQLSGLRQSCQSGPHAVEPGEYFDCVREGLTSVRDSGQEIKRAPIAAPRTSGPIMLSESGEAG